MTDTPNLLDRVATDVMTRNPVTIARDTLAAEVLNILEQRKITSIVVVDAGQNVQGVRAPARPVAHGNDLEAAPQIARLRLASGRSCPRAARARRLKGLLETTSRWANTRC